MKVRRSEQRQYFALINKIVLKQKKDIFILVQSIVKDLKLPFDVLQWRSQLDNWGANIHIFVFCVINFF